MESVLRLFSPGNFMPHGHCYYWEPYLLWSHALSDGIIALAYCSIPLTLLHIYLKRKRDFQFLWMALLFAVFILGCGMTHVFDVITIWNPVYYADSLVRIVTAAASIGTALVLIRITPRLLLIPSAQQWANAQATLQAQLQELQEKDRIISQANTELSYRLEQLFAAQELSQVGSFETDYGQDTFTGTPELYRIFGWPVELAGQPTALTLFHSSVHAEDIDWVREKVKEALQKGESYAFTYRIVLPGGTLKHLLVQARVLPASPQRLLSRGTVMDVTRRYEQERELQRLNQELTVTNEELRMTQEELVTANEELAATNEELEAANEQLTTAKEELEQRVAERTEALRQSEERYRVFIEQSSEGISRFELENIDSFPVDLPEEEQLALFSRYGCLAECNDAMARMYGYRSARELIGLKLEDFLPLSLPANRDYFIRFIRSGYQLSDAETVELDQAGNAKYFINNLQGVVQAGRLIRAWCTQRDITAQKEAQQALQQREWQLKRLNQQLAAGNEELRAANEQIQSANQALAETNRQLTRTNRDLDNFVYTASHDLKAPILNIEGLLKALEKQLSREERQSEALGQIYGFLYDSVNRFKATIGDLTQVATISKENPEDVVRIPLNEVLAEVLKDLAPQIQQAGVQMEMRLDCPAIQFSRKNLKSILYNLLSNAIKYRSPDRASQVKISCQQQQEYYVLSVEDNGLGIDMRHEDKIFALFKRLHTHVEGTGIGLYIVKRMLENAGGRIQVESKVGVGSTFSVYFKR